MPHVERPIYYLSRVAEAVMVCMRDGRTLSLSRKRVASVLRALEDEPADQVRVGALSLRAQLQYEGALRGSQPLDLTRREEAALVWALGAELEPEER